MKSSLNRSRRGTSVLSPSWSHGIYSQKVAATVHSMPVAEQGNDGLGNERAESELDDISGFSLAHKSSVIRAIRGAGTAFELVLVQRGGGMEMEFRTSNSHVTHKDTAARYGYRRIQLSKRPRSRPPITRAIRDAARGNEPNEGSGYAR